MTSVVTLAPPPPTLSTRRKAVFAVVAILAIMGLSVGALLVLDIYMHHRVQDVAGVNVWGYRGRVVGSKKADETRIVVLGGSTAFGYGLLSSESFPAYLERDLNAGGDGRTRFTVVNLGVPGEGAYGFRFDLADYAYLRYDLVVLYEGYNDLGPHDIPDDVPHPYDPTTPSRLPRTGLNDLLWRRQSPVFRLTGYFPILPLVFREKAMAMMAGGDLDAAYRGRAVFRPGLAKRAGAAALMQAAAIADAVGAELGRLSNDQRLTGSVDEAQRRRSYVANVTGAVADARARGAKVLVVTQPYVSDAHIRQQRALAVALADQFAHDPGVRYVDLGTLLDLRDRTIAYDGLHLVAEGNKAIAARLVQPARDLLALTSTRLRSGT